LSCSSTTVWKTFFFTPPNSCSISSTSSHAFGVSAPMASEADPARYTPGGREDAFGVRLLVRDGVVPAGTAGHGGRLLSASALMAATASCAVDTGRGSRPLLLI